MRGSLRRKRILIPNASLVAIVVLLAVLQWTELLFPLRGPYPGAMFPTIPAGGQVLAEGFSYRFRDPHRGEIVRFRVRGLLGGPSFRIPSRTISRSPSALPAFRETPWPDTMVECSSTARRRTTSPRLRSGQSTSSFRPVHVGRDKYFVLGDNRSYAQDSRDFGHVPRRAIFARLVLIVWPFGRFGVPAYNKSLAPPGSRFG